MSHDPTSSTRRRGVSARPLPAASSLSAAGLALFIGLGAAPALAGVVTLGGDPQPLPSCPTPGLPGLCRVDTAAQATGVVTDFSKIRIGQSGAGSLRIGNGASVVLDRLDLAPGIPSSPDVVVGDQVQAVGSLSVEGSGRLHLTVPDAGAGSGGLFLGPFAAPLGHVGPSTTAVIRDGGQVRVDKPGGFGTAAAVGVGYGAGSFSSLLLDGGVGDFGAPVLGARLDTTGNLSVGREGHGMVNLLRHADVTAQVVYLSTLGTQGVAELNVGVQSRLQADLILAGIGLGPGPLGYDRLNPSHGQAVISAQAGGVIAAPLVMGPGATLLGSGTVGTVTNLGGTVRPGNSPGTLTVEGDWRDEGGFLEFEIGFSGSDLLQVAGDVTLEDTTLMFRFIEGFAPAAGWVLDVLRFDGDLITDDLRLGFSGLAPGFQFALRLDETRGVLRFEALNDAVALPVPSSLPLVLAAAAALAALQNRQGGGARRRRGLAGTRPRASH